MACATRPSRLTDPRVVATVAVLWCVVIIVMYWWCGGMSATSGYILWNFGPSDKLYFIGLSINTWTRWGVFNAMILVDTVLNIWILEALFTWISLEVYDRNKDDVRWGETMFTDRMVVLVAAAYCFYSIIHSIVWLYLALTSADTQLLIICISLTMTGIIVRLYMREKTRRATLAAAKRSVDSPSGVDVEMGRPARVPSSSSSAFKPARGDTTLGALAPTRTFAPRQAPPVRRGPTGGPRTARRVPSDQRSLLHGDDTEDLDITTPIE